MTITVKTKDLLRIVNLVAAVTPTRTTLPSLNAVLLAYNDCVLTAFASDLRMFARAHCEAAGEQSMAFGVRADLLAAFLSACHDETAEITVDYRATITIGTMKAVMAVVKADEFKEYPAAEGQTISLPSKELKEALSRVIHAASDDSNNKATLCSVSFDFENTLSLAAYSGVQLAAVALPVEGQGKFIVPRELISTLIKTLDDSEIPVTVTMGENLIFFACGDWALSGVLISGQFPNWRNVEKFLDGAIGRTFNREQLTYAFKNCVPFAEGPGFVRVHVVGYGTTATVEVAGQNATSSQIAMDGPAFEFFVEGRKMGALLSAVKGESVTLMFSDKQGHGIVVREDNFTAAIMPLEK